MNSVKINTTQNIVIEYRIANVGFRVLSCLIDLIVVAVLAGGLVYLFEVILPKFVAFDSGLKIILYIVVFFIISMYDLICEITLNGQSFGKKILGIKVIKLDGSQPTFISYFLRWVFRLLEIYSTYGSLAIVTIMMNGKGQRIGDIAAGTAVVSIRNKDSINDTIYMELDEGYTTSFESVNKLAEKDIHIVKEVIEFARKNKNSKHASNLLSKTCDKIKEMMGVQSDMNDLLFLETILKDYNKIHNI